MVLECAHFSPRTRCASCCARSRDEHAATPRVQVRVDTAFAEVMRQCAAPRDGQPGTWITAAMQEAYLAWHQAGVVHSIETWIDGELAGGLYGISLGRMFYGESMFTRSTDASKIALAYLVRHLTAQGVALIDCQQQTHHLASLGARPIARSKFLQHVRAATAQPSLAWTPGWLDSAGMLHPLARKDEPESAA